jgi:hypothetical protein
MLPVVIDPPIVCVVTPLVLDFIDRLPVDAGAVIETTFPLEVALMPADEKVLSAFIADLIELAKMLKLVSPELTVYCRLCTLPDREVLDIDRFTLSPVVGLPPRVMLDTTIELAVSVPVTLGLIVITPIDAGAVLETTDPLEVAAIPAAASTLSDVIAAAREVARIAKVVSVG